MEPAVISVENVSVHRGNFVLPKTSFKVDQGECLALVGANGAGKSTLISLILGTLAPSTGRVLVEGRDAWKRSNRKVFGIGYVADDARQLVPELTAEEYWEMARGLQGLGGDDAIRSKTFALELADLLQFSPPRGPIASFSHGMAKKTQMIAAFQSRPPIILLDEPSNGLDEGSWMRFSEALDSGLLETSAVVVSLHDLKWTERHATRIVQLPSARGEEVHAR